MANLVHRLVQLLLVVTLIDYSLCNCAEKLERCDNTLVAEMKAIKWSTADTEYRQIYYDVCSNEGIYNRFVSCVRPLLGQCDNDKSFLRAACQSRSLKLNTYRYTWKTNLLNDVCYRTLPIFDVEFFRHEKCISKVLNQKGQLCDTEHYKMVKATSGTKSCPHWNDFRQCSQTMVQNECGVMAANISAYMFHSHASYFTKYTVCNFTALEAYGQDYGSEGGQVVTDCWYDWLLKRISVLPHYIGGGDQTSTMYTPTTASSVPTITTTTTTTTTTVPSTTQSAAESNSDYTWSHSPKHRPPHTTSSYVTVRSKDSSSSEATEWNKASSSVVSTEYEEVEKKENKAESSYKYEDNSIHEEKHEERHVEEDDDDHDNDGGHHTGGEEEKVVDMANESYKEKKKSHKHLHHHTSNNGRTPVHGYGTGSSLPTVDSIMPELFQNDADLKSNGTSPAASKSAVVARESKALTSNSQPGDASGHHAGGNGSTSTTSLAYGPSMAFFSSLISLVLLFLVTL
ncbi:hypothetical protein TYRP_016596 [Tyrophagus putrescentiae]|nr:hypothetical protein TYRP_016596 [Tyrophagus putrescentiae]